VFAVTLVLALGSLFNVRYAFVALPAYVAVLALGVLELRRWTVRFVAAAVVVLTATSLVNHYTDPRFAKADARAAAAFMSSMVERADAVILMPAEMPDLFDRYFPRGSDRIDQYVFFHTFWAPKGIVDRERRPVPFDDLLEQHSRVWLFLSRGWETDPDDVLRRYFHRHHRLIEQREFAGLSLLLFEVNRSAQRLALT
jgi:hypothetical protein